MHRGQRALELALATAVLVSGVGLAFLGSATGASDGTAETDDQKQQRMKLAEAELKKKFNANMVKAILSHDRGQTPRAFASLVAEDGLGLGGHSADRHVYGTGSVTDKKPLALRVCLHVPAYCPGKAGAFAEAFIERANSTLTGADSLGRPGRRQSTSAPATLPEASGQASEPAAPAPRWGRGQCSPPKRGGGPRRSDPR